MSSTAIHNRTSVASWSAYRSVRGSAAGDMASRIDVERAPSWYTDAVEEAQVDARDARSREIFFAVLTAES